MRRRTVLLTIFILAVLAVSAASLAFPEIHIGIPGVPRIDRASTGPLGLKLGLDLQGGAHLVYQADTGTVMTVTFPGEAAADTPAVEEALATVDYQGDVSQSQDGLTFRISGEFLGPERRAAVLQALTDAIAEPVDFITDDTPPPTNDQMEGVLGIISNRVNLYGTEEPIVQRFGDDRIIVQLPGASGSVVSVEFVENADVEKLGSVIFDQGYGNDVESRGDNRFRVTTEATLDSSERQALRRHPGI